MKRHSDKKLYEVVIKELQQKRLMKGDKKYVFAFYSYDKGCLNFYFVEEEHEGKDYLNERLEALVTIISWAHFNDYKTTLPFIYKDFNKIENKMAVAV